MTISMHSAVPIAMYLGIMGGCVHAAYLMVLEVVVLSPWASGMLARLRCMYQSGQRKRFFAEICGIAGFFLVQPLVTTALVVATLSDLDPNFSVDFMRQLRQSLGT